MSQDARDSKDGYRAAVELANTKLFDVAKNYLEPLGYGPSQMAMAGITLVAVASTEKILAEREDFDIEDAVRIVGNLLRVQLEAIQQGILRMPVPVEVK